MDAASSATNASINPANNSAIPTPPHLIDRSAFAQERFHSAVHEHFSERFGHFVQRRGGSLQSLEIAGLHLGIFRSDCRVERSQRSLNLCLVIGIEFIGAVVECLTGSLDELLGFEASF